MVRAGIAATAALWLLSASLVGGQAAQGARPPMAEEVFKNIQVLKGIPVDEFLGTIGEMTMLETLQERYFTPEQLRAIKEGREQAGPETLNRLQESWAELIALIRT